MKRKFLLATIILRNNFSYNSKNHTFHFYAQGKQSRLAHQKLSSNQITMR